MLSLCVSAQPCSCRKAAPPDLPAPAGRDREHRVWPPAMPTHLRNPLQAALSLRAEQPDQPLAGGSRTVLVRHGHGSHGLFLGYLHGHLAGERYALLPSPARSAAAARSNSRPPFQPQRAQRKAICQEALWRAGRKVPIPIRFRSLCSLCALWWRFPFVLLVVESVLQSLRLESSSRGGLPAPALTPRPYGSVARRFLAVIG